VARTEVRLFEAELRRLEGGLRLLAGEPEAGAEACFVEALAIARRQEAKSLELRAATGLAPPLPGGEKRAEAHDLLASVYGWFTEGFGTPDLRDAKALLDELR
jgi:predicted ATPase